MHKPYGWMDQPHGRDGGAARVGAAAGAGAPAADDEGGTPRDDDERFVVSLVLSYYRRHPERARTRLLDLLGEVLAPAPEPDTADAVAVRRTAAERDAELWRRAAGCRAVEPRNGS